MKYIVKAVWWLQVATWVWLAPVQAMDAELLLQQQHSRPVKMVRDKIASGIAGRSLNKGAVESFTIVPHYDQSVNQLMPHSQGMLKIVLINTAVVWLRSVLKVRPMATPIKFERECPGAHSVVNGLKYCYKRCTPLTQCGPVTIPQNHLAPCRRCLRSGRDCEEGVGGDGITNAHFLLYVSALPEPHCRRASLYAGTSLVKASHCLQEKEFDRPVAGYVNFCPEALSTYAFSLSAQLSTLLHELVHALVFSQELFPYFHNEQGYPRSHRTDDGSVVKYPVMGLFETDPNTLRLIRRTNWTALTPGVNHSVTMIVTPHVVREVREHFNCSSLEGAELENQGGGGVARMHWENRVFGEELMTGVLSAQPVLSRVTLALFHDSGWYLPDYKYGGQLHWGRGKGCLFVKESCGAWIKHTDENKEPSLPFCDGQDYSNEKMGCVNGRTAIGPCFIRNYTIPLPKEYQYLSSRGGGTQILADYCPLFGVWEYGEHRVGKSCLNPDHAPSSDLNFAEEVYDHGSRCFEQVKPIVSQSNLSDNAERLFKRVEGKVGPVCYKFSCTDKRVLVEIGNEEVPCRMEGRKKSVKYKHNNDTYMASIICPAYSELCQAYDCINRCSDHGTCHRGKCYCYHGYHGEDCSQSYLQQLFSCTDVTCLNNGNCSETGGGGFICSCPTDFTGARCEQKAIPDPCIDFNCNGNGYCTRTNGGREAKCNCYHGFGGRKCKTVKDLCAAAKKPCLNHNSCVVNSTRCECSSEYWGEQCENRVDFCAPVNPCSVGERCLHHNHTQNYSCVCPEGYAGLNCSEPIVDRCAKSPCSNNGTCVNRLDGYECLCPRGYKGGRCRQRENPCKQSPCAEHGHCRKIEGGVWGAVYCECDHGYYGDYCECHSTNSSHTCTHH